MRVLYRIWKFKSIAAASKLSSRLLTLTFDMYMGHANYQRFFLRQKSYKNHSQDKVKILPEWPLYINEESLLLSQGDVSLVLLVVIIT